MPGITLYMQPVQDLTIDSTVSRTQYQFVLQSPKLERFRHLGAAPDGQPAARCPRSSTSPATCRPRAWRCSSRSTATPPRASASPPATIDNALYDAFGQRIVSTIFTQSNQYRVIFEVEPAMGRSHRFARQPLSARPPAASRCRCRPSPPSRSAPRRCRSTIWASSRPPPSPSTWRRAIRWARRSTRSSAAQARDRHAACRCTTHFQGAALAFQESLDSQLLLILAAIVTVYIVLGVLYESFIHPDHDPVDPAVGRRRRAAGADDRRAPISASSPSSASFC